MNTKLIMISSAVVMGLVGAVMTFMPIEFLNTIEVESSPMLQLVLQAFGASYVGFALLNWTAKGSAIGGIYNRPIALGNLVHFTVVAIALVKLSVNSGPELSMSMWAAVIAYVALAVLFARIVFGKPSVA